MAGLAAALGRVVIPAELRSDMAEASERLAGIAREREALLDYILECFAEAPGEPVAAGSESCPTHWAVQVSVAEIQAWRKRRQA